jgi:hypothetical protein
MQTTKYELNDVIYFVHGSQIVKGIIDEFILHYTQTKVIVKYIIRPYGLKDHVTIDEDKIYTDIEVAKKYVIDELTRAYTKENIKKNYEEAKQQMAKKYEDQLNNFDELFEKAISNISSISQDYYDKLETEYQKTKENEDVK